VRSAASRPRHRPKLIWPSPLGVGIIDPLLWEQTVTVALNTLNADEVAIITAEPGPAAYTNQYAEAANAALTAEGLNTTGDDFAPISVELKEGGA
jgi:NitT/TauT family transport system substrate-binding protein